MSPSGSASGEGSDGSLSVALAFRLDRLRTSIAALGGAAVAYSGGVDSTLVAFVAAEQLGERALACTAVSPSMAGRDVDDAVAVARRLGIRHRLVPTTEVELESYARNAPNRCYVCRRAVFGRLRAVAREEGLPHLLHGAHLDDPGDFRPGARAAEELGVLAPLADAGLGKEDVRALARHLRLPNADRPSAPCLSSRIPYGDRVTPAKLGQVESAERALHDLGFGEVRVRHHGSVARIEVPARDVVRLVEPATRAAILAALGPLGFAYVTVDLRGLRSGSLNEVLAPGAGPG